MQKPREQIAQQTYQQTDIYFDDSENEDVMYIQRHPNSAIRLNNPTHTTRSGAPQTPAKPAIQRRSLAPGQRSLQPGTYIDGNTRLNVHQGAPPPAPTKRNKAHARERDTEDTRPRGFFIFLRQYGLVIFGIIAIVMIVGFIAISYLASWWQGVQDNWHYGMPRTFQTDYNVGHYGRVSHFIVVNNQGEIEIIETQRGHPEASKIYTILLPQEEATVPASITFEDINHDGKIDALIHYGEGSNQTEVPMYNNGTTFQTQPPGK